MAEILDPQQKLTNQQLHDAALADWRRLPAGLHARFATGDFAAGLRLADAIGLAADEANHHPDLDLRYGHLSVRLVSHDVGGVTSRDVAMARSISALAAEAGASAEPGRVQEVELAIDTADASRLVSFWRAVYGLAPDEGSDQPGGVEVVDPDGVMPTIWFQDTEPHEEPRQRFHLDVWVAEETADARIEQALGAGGTLVSDTEAPSFTVLADADGNKACICSVAGRHQPPE
ncbi:4a-hydroxytetrahydrobiopterin dehydratase [Nocardioides sp. Soil797]|nr:4a-hydroxytetrahydrobiopterin dehydratase [Nocardioides sp. Soil797]